MKQEWAAVDSKKFYRSNIGLRNAFITIPTFTNLKPYTAVGYTAV